MKPAFDIKTSRLDVLSIHLHTADLTELKNSCANWQANLKTNSFPSF